MINRNIEPQNKKIKSFLEAVENLPVSSNKTKGSLIFAMDATASRGPTWDVAISIQSQMFHEAAVFGGLEVQLVFYRGFSQCNASKWTDSSEIFGKIMSSVNVLPGRTQIERILRHAINQSEKKLINALIFIGDAMEEDIDILSDLAGRLGLRGVPIFIFHEGGFEPAASAFRHIAMLSGGAYSPFDTSSPDKLSSLMRAIGAFVAGGHKALNSSAKKFGGDILKLANQVKGR